MDGWSKLKKKKKNLWMSKLTIGNATLRPKLAFVIGVQKFTSRSATFFLLGAQWRMLELAGGEISAKSLGCRKGTSLGMAKVADQFLTFL